MLSETAKASFFFSAFFLRGVSPYTAIHVSSYHRIGALQYASLEDSGQGESRADVCCRMLTYADVC